MPNSNNPMNDPTIPVARAASATASEAAELLSRLLDGDADGAALDDLCRRWREDASVRTSWHEYLLIGDVLRSEELASTAAHDAAFLERMRRRLSDEPAIVAPAGAEATVPASAVPGRQRRTMPLAIAAGFVVVAGVLVATRLSAPVPAEATAVQARAPMAGPGLMLAGGQGSDPADARAPAAAVVGMDAALIRDARIDRYFEAHRGMRGSPAAAVPGGALRSVDTLLPQR